METSVKLPQQKVLDKFPSYKQMMRQYVMDLLEFCEGDMAKVKRVSGAGRPTVYRWIIRYDLKRFKYEVVTRANQRRRGRAY